MDESEKEPVPVFSVCPTQGPGKPKRIVLSEEEREKSPASPSACASFFLYTFSCLCGSKGHEDACTL